ncbi:MAG: Fmu (Sun) domain-containing protein [Chitinophagaceae bacterium]|nr:Fmu (Sun) domain-containing protein [Chitinophagaceae bacterium]
MLHPAHPAIARQIIQQYDGKEPFSAHLKRFFSQYKKAGSTDRKTLAAMCYSYFRASGIFPNDGLEEKIIKSFLLCHSFPVDALPEPFQKFQLQLQKHKVAWRDIFPNYNLLSAEINRQYFTASLLKQPALFLRIRPGKNIQVLQKLKKHHIPFEEPLPNCLKLPNSIPVHSILALNREAVIQDISSQQTGEFISYIKKFSGLSRFTLWDCCAGSGGKSILAYDLLPSVSLFASDVRASILLQLKKRFREAGIGRYTCIIADLSKENSLPDLPQFDVIVADVPCTGSGTWARTPENIHYFTTEKLTHYTTLQKKIISNAVPFLRPGGYLLYITCSVFKEENEFQIRYLSKECHLIPVQSKYFTGYDKEGDTLFASLFRRPSQPDE